MVGSLDSRQFGGWISGIRLGAGAVRVAGSGRIGSESQFIEVPDVGLRQIALKGSS
jgi:hypothetical protein